MSPPCLWNVSTEGTRHYPCASFPDTIPEGSKSAEQDLTGDGPLSCEARRDSAMQCVGPSMHYAMGTAVWAH
jgi:hypothetical protein